MTRIQSKPPQPRQRRSPQPSSPQPSPPEPLNPLLLPGKLLRSLTLLGLGGAFSMALVLGFGVLRAGETFVSDFKALFNAPQPEPQIDVRSVVVQQVREVSELSTAVFTMEAVVPTQRDRTLGAWTVGTTTLLYMAYGEVRAGVDLSQLQPSDVALDPSQDKITITLPPAQILDQKIDVGRSAVYDYNRGFLGLGPDSAVDLQSLASQAALDRIVTAACEQNILEQANARARLVVTQLLLTAGHRQVDVQTQPAIACGIANPDAPAPSALPQR